MTPEQFHLALDAIKQLSADQSERRVADMESYLDHADRTIAQLAQLKLLNESGLSPIAAALMEAAKSANPL